MMKKISALLLAVIILCGCATQTKTMIAEVVENNDGVIALEDQNGDIWIWEIEPGEQFEVGQIVEIEFDEMGTSDIYDDEIIKIWA